MVNLIVIFGGGNVVGPLTLGWFASLAQGLRLVSPDTIGQPGLSAGVRVSGSDESLGQWALDVIDAAELQAPAAIGVSYGAGILLRLAELAPERVRGPRWWCRRALSGSPIPRCSAWRPHTASIASRSSRARAASVTAMLAH